MNTEHFNPFELREYQVERPSVSLLRVTTKVVGRVGKVHTLLLTREIARLFELE